ncbi:hypothetical protein E9993_16835 [Labilibacter sediminis]|nr:hypothetical protein E9993_16835 [Labilibacter sediminis]
MNTAKQHNNIFSSKGNGKLLLSGEYMVLRGAKTLSVPLQLGQSMDVYQNNQDGITWEAHHPNGPWHKVSFNDKLTITYSSDDTFAKTLQQTLRCAIKMSKMNLSNLQGLNIVTKMDFMPEWGLGSSSTLIYNLSKFLKIDPYELLKNTFKGSGYDIANAKHNKAIFYQINNGKPQCIEVSFNPSFKDCIYFVYLGNKQSSKSSIKGFHKKKIDPAKISRISAISTLMSVCSNLTEFKNLMEEHETIIGETIGKTSVMQKQFSDFKGSIKSLGAWGGDFVMVVSDHPKQYVNDYFRSKNLNTIFKYYDLVLNAE